MSAPYSFTWWSDGHSFRAVVDPGPAHTQVRFFGGPDEEHRGLLGVLTLRDSEVVGFLAMMRYDLRQSRQG